MDLYPGRRSNRTGTQKTGSSTSSGKTNACKVIFASVLFLLSVSYSNAQFSQLEISSSQHFFLGINDTLAAPASKLKYTLDSVTPGKLGIWIITDSSLKKNFFELKCSPFRKYTFQLTEDEELVLNPVSEQEIDTLAPVAPVKKPSKKPRNIPSTDKPYPGLTLDSLFLRINLKQYSGQTGCTNVWSDIRFKQEFSELRQLLFETERVSAALKLIQERCLLVIQLGQLLELTEFDDNRHELIVAAKDHVFDLENLPQLAQKFTLNSQREKFLKSLEND